MKDKIEVGEYVRTNKGNIGKIVEIRLGFNKDTQLYQDIYIRQWIVDSIRLYSKTQQNNIRSCKYWRLCK